MLGFKWKTSLSGIQNIYVILLYFTKLSSKEKDVTVSNLENESNKWVMINIL